MVEMSMVEMTHRETFEGAPALSQMSAPLSRNSQLKAAAAAAAYFYRIAYRTVNRTILPSLGCKALLVGAG